MRILRKSKLKHFMLGKNEKKTTTLSLLNKNSKTKLINFVHLKLVKKLIFINLKFFFVVVFYQS